MAVPAYQAKAELFRTLAHPAEVRDLLLAGRRIMVHLAPEVDLEWGGELTVGAHL